MATVPYQSFEMHGIKEEFANWVSNIDPSDTPFSSMIGKFPIKNTHFQWQTDILAAQDTGNAHIEGEDAAGVALTPTTAVSNYTQIMRRVVIVSDTANAVTSYGREKELFYQLKKAAKALKRDQESIFLQAAQTGVVGTATTAALTSSLGHMIDGGMQKTAAAPANFEDTLFELTQALYTAGADANIIMFSPDVAKTIAALQETSTGARNRIFENTKNFVMQVETITDPLGQSFRCVVNRWLPSGVCYIFNPSDIGMAVLRAPQQIKLNKTGSAEKYMIEQEVGLRLNNPKAAGMLTITAP